MKTVYVLLASAGLVVGVESTGTAQNNQVNDAELIIKTEYDMKSESLLLSKYTVRNETRVTELFHSENTIKLENDFVVPEGKSVHIVSGTEIILEPGFVAEYGSEFVAEIRADATFNLVENKVTATNDLLAEQNFDQLSVYPNPVENTATIGYDIVQDEQIVSLKLYDLSGNVVSTIIESERQTSGRHKATLNTSHLPNGVYYYRLEPSSTMPITRKLIVSR